MRKMFFAITLVVSIVFCFAAHGESLSITMDGYIKAYNYSRTQLAGLVQENYANVKVSTEPEAEGYTKHYLDDGDIRIPTVSLDETGVVQWALLMFTGESQRTAFIAYSFLYSISGYSDPVLFASEISNKFSKVSSEGIVLNGYSVNMTMLNAKAKTLIMSAELINASYPIDPAIKSLMQKSPSTDVNFESGEYVVGVHISSGEYSVTPVKSAIINVYRNGSVKTSEFLSTTDNEKIGRLVLQDGDRIEISGGKLSFTPYK